MKATIIIMSAISILDFLFALLFGAWIHCNENLIVDGTNLLEVHIVQGVGTMIISLITLGLMVFRNGSNKPIILTIGSILCMVGLLLTWISGWFLYTHDGTFTAFARSINMHEIQAISTAILTIAILVILIIREARKEKDIKPGKMS